MSFDPIRLAAAQAERDRQLRLLSEMDRLASHERVEVYVEGKKPSLSESWWFAYGERKARYMVAERELSRAKEGAP
jgi:hypothetical protein